MAGKPIFDKAMSATERQRRWRARVKARRQADPLAELVSVWNRLDDAEQDRFIAILFPEGIRPAE